MPLRKQAGNMYDWVTHTWNPVKGKCRHNCSYCYMKRFPLGELRFDEREMNTNLGSGNVIFVGSGTDLFASDVPRDWICRVFDKCREYHGNQYLFQSKNPKRMMMMVDLGVWPAGAWAGTTIESNSIDGLVSAAPPVQDRAEAIALLGAAGINTMVTIEPIMDFDPPGLAMLILVAQPKWVNIGADSRATGLPEPTQQKIARFMDMIKGHTEIRCKLNLERLLREKT